MVVVDASGPEDVSSVVGREILGVKEKEVGEGMCDSRNAEHTNGPLCGCYCGLVGLLGNLCHILLLAGRGSYLIVVVREEGVGWGSPGERAISVNEVDGVGDLVETLLNVPFEVRMEDNPSNPVGQGTVFFVRDNAVRKMVVVDRLAV